MTGGYMDLHCDTVTELQFPQEDLEQNGRMVCLDALRRGGAWAQCFSAFVPTGLLPAEGRDEAAWARFCQIADRKDALLQKHSAKLRAVLCTDDLDRCEDKVGLIFTIEDLGLVGSDADKVSAAYRRGVRIASLTWNHENALGFPNSADAAGMRRGLKPFGRQCVEQAQALGLLIDVSHLSDGGFWDVAALCPGPFVATHSNSRAVTAHPRNLTDGMIRTLADHGGVMGLNFAASFLSSRNDGRSRICDMVRHVLHIRNVGGSGVLALGSDFDGIDDTMEIPTPAQMPALFEALKHAGLSEAELEAMRWGNVRRVLEAVWR